MTGTKRPLRGILFDKDGTLIDFRVSWTAAYRGVAADLAALAGGGERLARLLLLRLGYDPLTDIFQPDSPLLWVTNERLAAMWAAQPELAALGPDTVRAIGFAHLADPVRYPPLAVTDLAALFARLSGRGYRLGIATMDETAAATGLARRFAIDGYCDFITGCDGGHGIKPDPGMVMGFCAACGLEPDEVVMVGDTHADMLMGAAAGCGLRVAVLTGGASRDMLAPLADHVLANIDQLEAVLGDGASV